MRVQIYTRIKFGKACQQTVAAVHKTDSQLQAQYEYYEQGINVTEYYNFLLHTGCFKTYVTNSSWVFPTPK